MCLKDIDGWSFPTLANNEYLLLTCRYGQKHCTFYSLSLVSLVRTLCFFNLALVHAISPNWHYIIYVSLFSISVHTWNYSPAWSNFFISISWMLVDVSCNRFWQFYMGMNPHLIVELEKWYHRVTFALSVFWSYTIGLSGQLYNGYGRVGRGLRYWIKRNDSPS